MSALHVLLGRDDHTYKCVVHTSIPVGNNLAGKPWRASLLASGLGGKTGLPVGTGPGQITTAEKAQIDAGELIETLIEFQDVPEWTPAERIAALDAAAAIENGRVLAYLQARLRYFGATR